MSTFGRSPNPPNTTFGSASWFGSNEAPSASRVQLGTERIKESQFDQTYRDISSGLLYVLTTHVRSRRHARPAHARGTDAPLAVVDGEYRSAP